MPTLDELFPLTKKPLVDPTQSAVSTPQVARPGSTQPAPAAPAAPTAAPVAPTAPAAPAAGPTAPITGPVAPATGPTPPTAAPSATGPTTPATASPTTQPAVGSSTAFQQAFGKLMQNAQYNQKLQDQMYALIKAKYDHTAAAADPSLPPAVQEAIRTGNNDMIDFQIQNLRSQLQGRSTDMTNALNYLVQGYQTDAKNLADKQAAAQDTVNKWITAYGSNLGKAGITQDELNGFLTTGQLSPALATKLMNVSTITQQRYAAQYGAGTPAVSAAGTLDIGGHSYDFSSGGPSGIYATDPNWGVGVSNAIAQIGDLQGNPANIDAYIQSVAPGSPITSQMVTAASQQYGVPWEVLMAVMQQESSFGTDGLGAKTFNPGNVGNTDSGNTTNMGDWQAGVDAVAKKIADSEVPAGGVPLPDKGQEASAQDLANGRMTLAQLATAYPSRSAAGSTARSNILNRAREINPNLNVAQQAIQYSTANNYQFQSTLANINAVEPNIDKVIALSDAWQRTDYPAINALLKQYGWETGDQNVTTLKEAQQLIGDEIGRALTGSGTTSDFKVAFGIDVLDPNVSPANFVSNMQLLKEFLDNRKQAFAGAGGTFTPSADQPAGGANDPLGIL